MDQDAQASECLSTRDGSIMKPEPIRLEVQIPGGVQNYCSIELHVSEVARHHWAIGLRRWHPMSRTLRRAGTAPATVLLLILLSACGGWWDSEKDAVRRAIIVHELDEQGVQVDDLILRLSPVEFRADLGHGSRMVWLVCTTLDRQYRESEYFRARDPSRSYLFVQDIRFNDSHDEATAEVILGLGGGQELRKEITLWKKNGSWQVHSERSGTE